MRSRGALDVLTMLVLALPGTALGIAYIRAFNNPILFSVPLANLWIILPIVLAVRRLPYTVRSSYSSLLVVHRSMEEAAQSVGAGGMKTFKDVTFPLIWKGVLVGSLYSADRWPVVLPGRAFAARIDHGEHPRQAIPQRSCAVRRGGAPHVRRAQR